MRDFKFTIMVAAILSAYVVAVLIWAGILLGVLK